MILFVHQALQLNKSLEMFVHGVEWKGILQTALLFSED